jgi:hypothetical protein
MDDATTAVRRRRVYCLAVVGSTACRSQRHMPQNPPALAPPPPPTNGASGDAVAHPVGSGAVRALADSAVPTPLTPRTATHLPSSSPTHGRLPPPALPPLLLPPANAAEPRPPPLQCIFGACRKRKRRKRSPKHGEKCGGGGGGGGGDSGFVRCVGCNLWTFACTRHQLCVADPRRCPTCVEGAKQTERVHVVGAARASTLERLD